MRIAIKVTGRRGEGKSYLLGQIMLAIRDRFSVIDKSVKFDCTSDGHTESVTLQCNKQ